MFKILKNNIIVLLSSIRVSRATAVRRTHVHAIAHVVVVVVVDVVRCSLIDWLTARFRCQTTMMMTMMMSHLNQCRLQTTI